VKVQRGSAQIQEVQRLYSTHKPERLADIPALVEQYGEERLLSMVQRKYEAAPPSAVPARIAVNDKFASAHAVRAHPPGWVPDFGARKERSPTRKERSGSQLQRALAETDAAVNSSNGQLHRALADAKAARQRGQQLASQVHIASLDLRA
jgi:hypothetical protein